MRAIRILGPAILVAGLVALGFAVARGEARLYLVVIIPVIVGAGPLGILGILLAFLGFFLTFFLWPVSVPAPALGAVDTIKAPPEHRTQEISPGEPARSRRWGGVVFLGPIPLVLGSDPHMTRWMLILGAILFVALLFLTIALFLA